jgi:hypothetical protein
VGVEVDVVEHGDEIMVRCPICGLCCLMTIEVRVAQLQEFLDQHPWDTDPSSHPAQCPAWSRRVELPAGWQR